MTFRKMMENRQPVSQCINRSRFSNTDTKPDQQSHRLFVSQNLSLHELWDLPKLPVISKCLVNVMYNIYPNIVKIYPVNVGKCWVNEGICASVKRPLLPRCYWVCKVFINKHTEIMGLTPEYV